MIRAEKGSQEVLIVESTRLSTPNRTTANQNQIDQRIKSTQSPSTSSNHTSNMIFKPKLVHNIDLSDGNFDDIKYAFKQRSKGDRLSSTKHLEK